MTHILIDVASASEIPEGCMKRIAIVPIGSLEYHGRVLPFGTDSVIASRTIDYCIGMRREDNKSIETCLLKYPVLQYGFSPEWLGFEGTVSIDLETFIRLLRSILRSIESNVKPIGYVIVNAHGGNYYPLKSLIQEYYLERHVPIVVIDIWRIAGRHGLLYCHACETEAKLYRKLTGVEAHGSTKIFCRDLDGVYIEYSEGYCGDETLKSVDDMLRSICDYLNRAIETILKISTSRQAPLQ